MFQNVARSRGRPRSFDERDALEKATQVFWSKGYDGVTIDDLDGGMGVGRPSLYSVFGDKRTLFLRVLKDYAEKKGALAAKALLSPQTLRDSLARFLRYAVESATEEGSAPGCLALCVAPLVDDPEVRQFLQNAAARQVARRGRSTKSAASSASLRSVSRVVPICARMVRLRVKSITWRARTATGQSDEISPAPIPARKRSSTTAAAPAAAFCRNCRTSMSSTSGAMHNARHRGADPSSVALSTAYLRKRASESRSVCGDSNAFAARAPFFAA